MPCCTERLMAPMGNTRPRLAHLRLSVTTTEYSPYRQTNEFVCNEAFSVGCYYINSRRQMTWHAYTFDVGDRTVSNLRERGKRAWTNKQFQRQLSM